MKTLSLMLWTVFLFCACAGSRVFSAREKGIIGEDTGSEIMRLYSIDNKDENALLRKQSRPLSLEEIKSAFYQRLKERMLATVSDALNPGVGIAAPQVGISRKLIAVQRFDKANEPFEFYPNCDIIYYSDSKKWGWEGCLSVPDQRDTVLRSTTIIIRYLDEQRLESVRDTITGFTAVIFQHEVDHLNGRIFIDYK